LRQINARPMDEMSEQAVDKMLRTKRVYETPSPSDGRRILVDRLWPRGLTKEKAKVDEWRKDLAPSDALRKWYGHDPARWKEFRTRYLEELLSAGKADDLKEIGRRAKREDLTLVFASKNVEQCNAEALVEFIAKYG